MLALGAVVVLASRDARAGGAFGWRAALAIGLAYLGFGATAFVLRGGNPHFLGFIATGAALTPASRRTRPSRN